MAQTLYFKLFMFFLLPVSGSDPEVSCVFRQSCMLPCQIQFGPDLLIHWYQVSAGDVQVHSYYDGRDHLGHQNQNFQNRTSLFQDQISRGNVSLLLKEVKIQDEGRYKCYTSTRTGYKESFINLKTEAPVSTIRIHQDGNRITCSSEGIYPQPELTWSTEPPSNTALQNRTTVHQTEEKLYNINSSLTVPDNETDWIYSCTIRTRSNDLTETFKETGLPHKEDFLLWWLIGGPIAATVAALIIGVIVGCVCKRETETFPLNSNTGGSDNKQESRKQENKDDSVSEEPRETDGLKTQE